MIQATICLLQKYCNPFHCSLSTNTLTPRLRRMTPPDLPQELWLEIFQFATHVHQQATIIPLDPFAPRRVSNNVMAINTPSMSTRTKLSLVLVCHAWRRLAVQVLYSYIVIRSPMRANSILAALSRSSQGPDGQHGYGQWTRHIAIFTHARGSSDLRFLQTIFRILQACPDLRMLSGTWNYLLPLEFLDAISRLYGPSLQGMYWNDRPLSSASLEFLGSFRSLRVLDLCNFWGEIDRKLSPALPAVQTLIISDTDHSLAAATALLLPSLQNLTLKTYAKETPVDLLTSFLNAHGASLAALDLPSPAAESDPEPDTSLIRRMANHPNVDVFLQNNLCPNLMTLTFPVTSPPLSADIKHPLRRIGLRGVRADSLYPDKPTATKGHLMSFTPDRYPKLEVVRTVGFLVDADADSLIKDVFIWWVEKFEKQAVDFLDGEGVLWEYAPDSSSPPSED